MVQEGALLSWNEISQAERAVSDHLPEQSDFIWAAVGIVLRGLATVCSILIMLFQFVHML